MLLSLLVILNFSVEDNLEVIATANLRLELPQSSQPLKIGLFSTKSSVVIKNERYVTTESRQRRDVSESVIPLGD